MTQIHCLACIASLIAPDTVTANALANSNNWVPVKINDVDGSLCGQCAEWVDSPILEYGGTDRRNILK